MNIDSGFRAYRVFCSMKGHLSSKSYNILEGLVSKHKFVHKWNEERFTTDGKLYFIVDEKFPKLKDVVFIFAVYLYHNDKIHISDIIQDNFELWNAMKNQLNNFDIQLQIDMKKIKKHCERDNITFEDLIYSPQILSAKISMFTLIFLNMKYSIIDKIKADDELNIKRINKKKLVLEKVQLIFQKSIEKKIRS